MSYADLSGTGINNPYPDLQLAAPAGCPIPPMLIGVLNLPADPATKVQNFALCFRDYMGPGSAGFSSTMDCHTNGVEAHPILWSGFHRGSVPGCRTNRCYIGDAVVEKYWGDVKGLYR